MTITYLKPLFLTVPLVVQNLSATRPLSPYFQCFNKGKGRGMVCHEFFQNFPIKGSRL